MFVEKHRIRRKVRNRERKVLENHLFENVTRHYIYILKLHYTADVLCNKIILVKYIILFTAYYILDRI